MKVFSKRRSTDPKLTDARKTFEWPEEFKGDNVMWKLPRNIQWNDNIIVKEDEWAIFMRDGKVLHVFDVPGRYAMTTQNVPVLATLGAKVTGIRQLGEIYWVQKREIRGRYGTPQPLVFRDSEFGMVRIRAFGHFAFRVEDPTLLITEFVGTKGYTTSADILDWLRGELVKALNDVLGELKEKKNLSIVDIPAYLEEIEQMVLAAVNSDTTRYGLRITKIADLNLNLPEEVEEAIDKRGAISALGVNYMQYQVGHAVEGIGKGAEEGGGGDMGNFIGMGAGIGAGFAVGQVIAGSVNAASGAGAPQVKTCPKCGRANPMGANFCMNCGSPLGAGALKNCIHCGAQIPAGAVFCPKCGKKQGE